MRCCQLVYCTSVTLRYQCMGMQPSGRPPAKCASLLQALAELLTTNKLSELACLTLYLMYEKKNGKQSVWYEFIKVCRHCNHVSCTDRLEVHSPRSSLPALEGWASS